MESMMGNIPDIVGLCGVTLILLMYFMLQTERLHAKDVRYSVGNGLGSGLLLFSLFFDWNISAVILQCIWLALSAYGVYKAYSIKESAA